MRILLIKRGAIGDVLMTTPLIRQLRQNFTTAQIDYCVGKSSSVAIKDNKYIDNLIILEDIVFSISKIYKFIGFILSVRFKYDYIFILGKNWSINLLCKLSGAKLVGFARESISKYLLNNYVIYNDVTRYQVLYYLDLLQESNLAKVNYHDITIDLPILEKDKLIVEEKLCALNIPDNFIVLTNSGGNNSFETSGIRMLPLEFIMQLLDRLAKNTKVILLGGVVDSANYQNYIKNSQYKNNLVNLAGQLSISQSAYLLTKCVLFYVTDCGVMHFGISVGIEEKMICFFGPTNPSHILPLNTKCKVIWQDKDIYDKNYQINGKINHKIVNYFKKIDLNKIDIL